jgi:hypothetical protein
MRTLVDVWNNDCGYARIYAERDGYSYELSPFEPRPGSCERVSGYASIIEARKAAQDQLISSRSSIRSPDNSLRGVV